MDKTKDSNASLLAKLFDYTLDVKGSIYGDEQERLRWYEGITVAASLQWIIVPWVIAVSIWMGGRPVVSYMLAVTAALYIPQLITLRYAMKTRVRLQNQWSAKGIIAGLLSGGSYVAIAAGAVRAYDNGFDPAGLRGAAVGGPIGLLVALALAHRYNKRSKAVHNSVED
jgi:hypothetical protein